MHKNGSDVQVCRDAEDVLPEEPTLSDNPIVHQQRMWDICAAATVKNEEILKQNLQYLYAVVLSMCDVAMLQQDQVH